MKKPLVLGLAVVVTAGSLLSPLEYIAAEGVKGINTPEEDPEAKRSAQKKKLAEQEIRSNPYRNARSLDEALDMFTDYVREKSPNNTDYIPSEDLVRGIISNYLNDYIADLKREKELANAIRKQQIDDDIGYADKQLRPIFEVVSNGGWDKRLRLDLITGYETSERIEDVFWIRLHFIDTGGKRHGFAASVRDVFLQRKDSAGKPIVLDGYYNYERIFEEKSL